MSEFIRKQLDEIWQKTLTLLENGGHFDALVYDYWIKDSQLYDLDEDFATILVPFKINKQIMMESIDIIQSTLSGVLEYEIACQIFLREEMDRLTNSSVAKARNDFMFENKIKEDYTFDSFVIGKNNREAQAAALSCCYYPGKYNNPVFDVYKN